VVLFLLSCTVSISLSASMSLHSDVNFNCSKYNNSCSECKLHEECFWCQWTKECASVENLNVFSNCSNIGWCTGDSCTCGLFPSTGSLASMVLMMLFYGAILAFGAKMIADGAEELLELFPDSSTIIGTTRFVFLSCCSCAGGLLLPVLGGLPDGIMILVSGLFANSRSEAQDQVVRRLQLVSLMCRQWAWARWPAPPSCCLQCPGPSACSWAAATSTAKAWLSTSS
jgi:hypothetical protein